MAKPAFNPDAPFEAADSEKPAFDPNAAYEPAEEAAPKQRPFSEISPLAAAVVTGTQGLTAGYGDEMAAGLGAAVMSPFSTKSYGELYNEQLKKQRQFLDQAAAQNPKTALVSEIGGTIASPINKFAAPAKGLSLGVNMGRAALGAGIIGGGKSQHNPLSAPSEAKGFLKDIGINAIGGGGMEGLFGAVGHTAGALLPDNLKKFARDRVLKSVTGNAQKFYEENLGPLADSTADFILKGSEKLGIPSLLGFGSRASDVTAKLEAARVGAGNAMNIIHKAVDEKQGGAAITGFDIAKKMIQKARNIPTNTQENLNLRRDLVRDAMLAKKQGRLTLDEAQHLQNQFEREQISKFADPTKAAKANLAEDAYNEAINDVVDRFATNAEKETYKEANKVYGDVKRVQKFNAKEGAREISNRWVSPSDYAMAGVGALYGGITAPDDRKAESIMQNAALGIGAGATNKFLRQRGSSIAASAAEGLLGITGKQGPRMLIGGAQNLSQSPAPNAFMQWLNRGEGTEEDY
jgi:hypothetical protein